MPFFVTKIVSPRLNITPLNRISTESSFVSLDIRQKVPRLVLLDENCPNVLFFGFTVDLGGQSGGELDDNGTCLRRKERFSRKESKKNEIGRKGERKKNQ